MSTTKILDEILETRRLKLSELEKNGISYPNNFEPNINIGTIRLSYCDLSQEELQAENLKLKTPVKLTGRIVLHRVMGKSSFAQISDHTGTIQILLKRKATLEETDAVEAEKYDSFKKWDLGDIVGVEGWLHRTQRGELTIKLINIQLLTKSLRPLPDKFHGLADQEIRYRQRYLDLISNPEILNTFKKRSEIIQIIRQLMHHAGYLEVETPMMHPIPGGTTAKPFITHHNTLNMDLYLRIAPELYLKKLIVGGFTKIFELNRSFRNEGLSSKHNPEFTMMEYYCAYSDYQKLMKFTENLIINSLLETHQTSSIKFGEHSIDFTPPFIRKTMKAAVLEYNTWLTEADLQSLTVLRQKSQENIPSFPQTSTLDETVYKIFELTVENKLIQPTFITEFPIEASPLARRNDQNPNIADRFELFIAGMEVGNGYSELNDSRDQAKRFLEQVKAKNEGNEEAMHYDDDFIIALEHGMPPTAGGGLGIDRLVMLFTNQLSIRDVILFPQMRPSL